MNQLDIEYEIIYCKIHKIHIFHFKNSKEWPETECFSHWVELKNTRCWNCWYDYILKMRKEK